MYMIDFLSWMEIFLLVLTFVVASLNFFEPTRKLLLIPFIRSKSTRDWLCENKGMTVSIVIYAIQFILLGLALMLLTYRQMLENTI